MSEICSEDKNVDPYVEGELSDEQKREFEHHLTECDECREQVEVARRLESAMQRVAAKMEKLHHKIEEKVARIDEKITARMEEVRERIERKTDNLDERIAEKMAKLHEKLEARATRMDEDRDEDMDEFSRDMDEFSRDMDEFSRDMDEFSRDMDEFGREMDEHGQEMDEFGREMDEFGREMDAFGREMEEFAREMEAEAPKWLAHSVMEKIHHTESTKAAESTQAVRSEPKRNWLLWLGCILFGVSAVALCVLVLMSGVGAWLGDAIAGASPQMENGILQNQTLLIGLALLPFGYGLFRVGQAMGYL
jgi:anti-sigma factor RsiW